MGVLVRCRHLYLMVPPLASLLLLQPCLPAISQAQSTPPITSSGLNTQVGSATTLPNGRINYDITGGTRPGNGMNLFHSFGEFSVPVNNIANFLNETTLPTTNILSRVTGEQPSNIFGTLQTTGFGTANLYLMNPRGIVFGPTAELNVGGSVAFTTANYLRLADDVRFNAVPGPQDALLTTAPVAAFGFLGASPAGISIQESALGVPAGQTLSVIGGHIQIVGGALRAPGGKVQLASLASQGEVIPSTTQQSPDLKVDSFSNLGKITLSPGSLIDTNRIGSGGGTVVIRGGRLTLDDANIFADTLGNVNGAPVGIDVQVAQDMVLTNGANITTDLTGAGNAGAIRVTTGSLDITNGSHLASRAFTGSSGDPGNITVTATSVNVSSGGRIESRGLGANSGNSGMLTVTATDTLSVSGFLSGLFTSNTGTGNAGPITVSAPLVELKEGGTIQTFTTLVGKGGAVDIQTHRVAVTSGSQIVTRSSGLGGGPVSITATDSITISGHRPGQDGNITPSAVATTTTGFGDAGSITLSAPSVELSDAAALFSFTQGQGNGGVITINTGRLTVSGGAQLTNSTQSSSSGQGGTTNVTASESVMISGQFSPAVRSGLFSGTSSAGNGGSIAVTAPTVIVENGAQISSSSTSAAANAGEAGKVTITAGGIFQSNGGSITTSAEHGRGGDILIHAGNVLLSSGTTVSAQSAGPRDAGNILVASASDLLMTDSAVTTSALKASGGNIELTASNIVRLRNSQVTSSVQGGPTTRGGNITIDPNFVILQNSQILAQAFAGQGGNINIRAGVFLADTNSLVSASSQFGLSGTVTIQSPTSNLSAVWARLQQNYADVAALVRARCAAQVSGQYSSFVQTGRDAIPLEPGGWLLSPLALEGAAVAPPVAQEIPAPALALAGVTLRGIDHDLSWPGVGKMPRRFASVLDIGCGS